MYWSSSRRALVPTARPPRRYRLRVNPTGDCIRIDDGQDAARTLLSWRGDVARRLLDGNPLLQAAARNGVVSIDKHELKRLTLRATTFDVEDSDPSDLDLELRGAEHLWQRLRDLGIRIPSFHSRVAKVLFRYPDEHLCAADAQCLTQLAFPNHGADRLSQCLDDLVAWRVVQRVAVGADVFYDLDIEPHLHLFDTRTCELTDAPTSGIVIR